MQVPIYPGRGTWPDWNNPKVLQRDRLPAHASFVPFPDHNSCRHAIADHRRYLSPSVMPLNGTWDFRYYPSLIQLPENILSFRSGFSQRNVPETEPIRKTCLSDSFPFPVDPPHITADQPVLVYRKSLEMPLLWGSLRKRIVLNGVRSACHVFINGKCAGYTQGSCLPAEFDITTLMHDGTNEIFIFCYSFSCGSYLEKQPERPWFGCIRDVYLEALPALNIHDIQVNTRWNKKEEAWRLDVSVLVVSSRIAVEQPAVRASLFYEDEPVQEALWTVVMKPVESDQFAAPVQTTGLLTASLLVRDVHAWSDEQPDLYDLYISIQDRAGRDLVCAHQAVGFRALKQIEDRLYVNGQPITLRAVRWSGQDEADPISRRGELITLLKEFKQSGLNTLYFQHEPPDPIILDLCDIYGFFVVEDAPLKQQEEWINTIRKLDSRLAGQWIEDRLERLVRRDYNHPCVIAWSCQALKASRLSEHRGSFQQDILDCFRELDPDRWLMHEEIPDLSRYLDGWTRSPDMSELSDLSWIRYPLLQEKGWCLFDYNGSPELLPAIKKALSPVEIKAIHPIRGRFSVKNKMASTDLSHLAFSWTLLQQGQAILNGEVDGLKASPKTEQNFEIWYGDTDFLDDDDYMVSFTIRWINPVLWAEKDTVVSTQSFILQKANKEPDYWGTGGRGTGGGRLRLESERHHLIVSGPRFWLVFNRIYGALESWRVGDREFIAARNGAGYDDLFLPTPKLAGLRCSLMRQPEPTDEPDWEKWIHEGYDLLWPRVVSIEDGCDGKMAIIDMIVNLGAAGKTPAFSLALRYEITAPGKIRVFASLAAITTRVLPPACFSLCFNPARTYRAINWFGSGPSRSLSRLGFDQSAGYFEKPLDTLIRPDREPGVFRELRYVNLCDDQGFGVSISSDRLFSMDVYHTESDTRLQTLAGKNRPVADAVVQLIHQPSLECKPLDEPLKLMFDLNPIL